MSAGGKDHYALGVGRHGDGIRLVESVVDGFAQTLRIVHGGRNFRVHLPLVGEFQIENALVDAGLVILAAVVAKFLYIALYLDDAQAHEPYLIAGLAGGIVTHHVMRAHQLHEAPAILAWRYRTGEVLLAIGLSFLILIATAYVLKISASYSRAWLLTWLCLCALAMTATRPATLDRPWARHVAPREVRPTQNSRPSEVDATPPADAEE